MVQKDGECKGYNFDEVCKCDPETTTSIETDGYVHYIPVCILKFKKNLERLVVKGSAQLGAIKGVSTLTNLKELSLPNNSIRKISGIKQLKKLEKLDLSGNNIIDTEAFVSSGTVHPKLKHLDLHDNDLSEFHLSFPSLEYLDLSGNGIVDYEQLHGLELSTNLKELNLSDNKNPTYWIVSKKEEREDDIFVGKLKELKKLERLYLKNMMLRSIKRIDGLNELTSLKELDLSNNKIKTLEGLPTLDNLEELLLYENEIDGKSLSVLSTFKNLKNLGIGGNNIKNIDGIPFLPNLDSLIFHDNNIQFHSLSPETLKKINHVKQFYVGENHIDNLDWIKGFKNLEMFNATRSGISNIKGLKNLRKLKELDLSGNNVQKIEGLKNLQNLKKIRLDGNRIKKIEGLDDLDNLKVVILGKNQIKKIEGVGNLKALEYLHLESNQIYDLEGLSKVSNIKNVDKTLVYVKTTKHPITESVATSPKTFLKNIEEGIEYFPFHRQFTIKEENKIISIGWFEENFSGGLI